MENKKEPGKYLSPIFEYSLSPSGDGFAGFTEHKNNEPFVNHIRHFTQEDRNTVLHELDQLRTSLQFFGDFHPNLTAKRRNE